MPPISLFRNWLPLVTCLLLLLSCPMKRELKRWAGAPAAVAATDAVRTSGCLLDAASRPSDRQVPGAPLLSFFPSLPEVTPFRVALTGFRAGRLLTLTDPVPRYLRLRQLLI